MYPIAQLELLEIFNRYELKEQLEDFLIFGSYPEVITAKSRAGKISALEEIVDSYLLKDILALEKVKGSKIILDLLKLLAFQVGNEVSLHELAARIKLDVKTVDRYLDILEKAFVIKRVGGFSRNLRKEITNKNKYYFLDNGIRNAVVSQFNKLDLRDDVGALWENFIFVERLKKRAYKNISGMSYFWRTYDQKEIDLIEEREGRLFGYEIKWTAPKGIKPPKDWLATYKNASYEVIHRENYLRFIV
ncbi:MAG: DUF4143 domain-containing protein [Ignavibacteria bacterium]|nr:DUF4143 domain-containing protein [Ignavibacteria bacterium]